MGVKTALDKIYSPAVVEWNVRIDEVFAFSGTKGDSFKTEGTGLLSKYTKVCL